MPTSCLESLVLLQVHAPKEHKGPPKQHLDANAPPSSRPPPAADGTNHANTRHLIHHPPNLTQNPQIVTHNHYTNLFTPHLTNLNYRRFSPTPYTNLPSHALRRRRPDREVRFPRIVEGFLCGFGQSRRGHVGLVVDGADHVGCAVSAVVVVEPVAPVQHNGLGLVGVGEVVS